MTSAATQIISPTWIAPVIPIGALLLDHSLVIEGDRIAALLPHADAKARFPNAPDLRLEGHLVTPGFVNVHGHAAMTLLRGIADDREMMDWLTNWIWPIEGELVSEQFVYDGTRLAAMEMIMGGTTCAADTYFFPEAASRALTQMHFRAQVGMPVLQFANAWARNEEDHIHKGLAFRDSIKNSSLVTTAFAPHSPYSVTNNGFNKVQLYSEQLDLPVHLHLHETATEVSDSLRDNGVRPIERMNKLGILSPSLQAVHMTQLRDDEIESLAINGVQVAHCPESNMKLASGFCPVEKLRARNINVAIGTDGAASNNDLDMIQEGRTASLLSKATTGDATSLDAQTCLEMMTINGARFLGLENEIGSLEPGKLADIASIDLSHPTCQPIYNPISQLIYTASARDVSNVWIGGKRVMENRLLPEIDIESILAATRQWQEKIAAINSKQP
ncbi:MAG: TRZ/ATZ family hydrolase [Candidatus Azotimanducaceae bacterium WSBS_2022_MAG_OTU7]